MKAISIYIFFLTLTCISCSTRHISDEEYQAASENTLTWLKNEYPQIRSTEIDTLFIKMNDRLLRAINSMTHATISFPKQEQQFRIILLQHAEPNAFSLGSGIIVLTQGLFSVIQTEAELAAIVTHEMAHDLLGHHRLALQSMPETESTNNAPQFVFTLEQELIADRLGLEILRHAHYDLRYTLSALATLTTISRPTDRIVAYEKWWESRTANLVELITNGESFLPATVTSREFMRARSDIIGEEMDLMATASQIQRLR